MGAGRLPAGTGGRLRSVILLALILVSPAASQVPPDQAWRTLESAHFRVHFPQGLEDLAGRAAERAERARAGLEARFLPAPAGRVDLVLTDHTDISNGFASPHPRNRIVIHARPPTEGVDLRWYDDWLEMVIAHELAHIHHLDHAGRPGRLLRSILGRVPLPWAAFPGWTVPVWVTEGIGTHYESELTDAGRGHGTWHETVLRVAALDGALERIDQASGASPVWPGGSRPYIYGSAFMGYLRDRHGDEAAASVVRAVAEQWIPYRLGGAVQAALDVSLEGEWERWRRAVTDQAEATAREVEARGGPTRPELLTEGARSVVSPRGLPDGEVLYLGSDGRSDAALHWLRPPDGGGGPWAARRRVRVQGVVGYSPLPSGDVLLAQYEFEGPYRLYADLYRISPAGGSERLTRGARLTHPDAHPTGVRAVAVQEGGGTNRLVEVDLTTGHVTPLTAADPGVHWSHPRWSPDGRWLAAIRWRPGARFELLIMDPVGGWERAVTLDRALDTSPAWSPDGTWLLWSSDRGGIFDLLAAPVGPDGEPGALRQVTRVVGAAVDPQVDPSGRWIHYAHYTAGGWEAARIPFLPGDWRDPDPPDPGIGDGGVAAAAGYLRSLDLPSRTYRPYRTLLPTWWSPRFLEADHMLGYRTLGAGVGAGIEGSDVVGRHAYRLEAGIRPEQGRGDWAAGYTFAGWGVPQLLVGARQEHSAEGTAIAPGEGGRADTLLVVRRERHAELGFRWPRATFRRYSSLTVLGGGLTRDRELLELAGDPTTRYRLDRPTSRFFEGRMALSTATARTFPFSISPENGSVLSLQGRVRHDRDAPPEDRGVAGLDHGFREATGQLRFYRSLGGEGFARRVAAIRVSGGVAGGPGAGRFHFALGGAGGEGAGFAAPGVAGTRRLLFPVRGFPEGAQRGSRAASGSIEFRLPLRLLHRGQGVLPLYGDRLSGALFLDGGAAWGGPGGDSPRLLSAAGTELMADGLLLWALPLRARVGVAVPLVEERSPSFYLRFGRSF